MQKLKILIFTADSERVKNITREKRKENLPRKPGKFWG